MLKRNRATLTVSVAASLSLLLASCATHHNNSYRVVADTSSLAGLKQVYTSRTIGLRQQQVSEVRAAAIKETALTLGAQSGLAYQAKRINRELKLSQRMMDQAFNFTALLMDKNVLPPVLQEGHNRMHLADDMTIRIADRTYRIAKQARFVPVAPNWRNYIWMNFQTPEQPDPSLLPKNAKEKALWDHFVTEGWNNGIRQATEIFSDNLAVLKQDFSGMVLYRKLLALNMVSKPYVAQTDLGITGDGSQMHINDKVLRITALPQLNLSGHTWKPRLPEETGQGSKMEINHPGAIVTPLTMKTVPPQFNPWQLHITNKKRAS